MLMASTKPTILLIHGAYHTPDAWERVIPHLEKGKYRCLAPQLCFCGTNEPISSWQTCIDQVRDILAQETSAGKDIVVVNHSLGGIPGCSAIQGFTTSKTAAAAATGGAATAPHGRVLGIVQISAMAIRDASHKLDFYARMAGPHPPRLVGASGWKNPPTDAKRVFYNDLDPDDAERRAEKLLPNAAVLDASVEGLYPGFRDVPVWYVMCTNDLAFPMAIQDEFVGVVREVCPMLTVRRIESGHSPMLSRPGEVAEIVDQAAIEFAGFRSNA